MNRFLNIFKHKRANVIGMIHVDALPGTPLYKCNWSESIEKAKHEANIYARHKLDSVLIENMHDIPYVRAHSLGPETVACMSRLASEVRAVLPKELTCGIQVLAGANREALAVAKSSALNYIRAEGFVFGHIADEGYIDACAGELLRYRRHIDAEDVLIFTDLKKKHSSHAITQDVSLADTAKAAEFFLSDGIIVTGNSTGHAANIEDVIELANFNMELPILIGSGVTRDNIEHYFSLCHAVIIGSHFKVGGMWQNELCEKTISEFMKKVSDLREG